MTMFLLFHGRLDRYRTHELTVVNGSSCVTSFCNNKKCDVVVCWVCSKVPPHNTYNI